MATVHTLNDLITLLQGAVQQKTVSGQTISYIVLSQSLLDEAGEVVGYFGDTAIELDYVVITPTNYNVTVSGVAMILHLSSTCLLTGTVENGVVRLTLSAIPSNLSSWTFFQNFPNLPPSAIQDNEGIGITTSFFTSTVFSKPQYLAATFAGGTFIKGLNFTATLDATQGELASSSTYIPNSNALPVNGKIVINTNLAYPEIDLKAGVVGLNINLLGTVKIQNCFVKLYATNSTVDEHQPRSGATLSGEVAIGSIEVIINAPLMQGDFIWGFSIDIPRDSGISLGKSLSVISDFLGGAQLPTPPGLPAGFDIYLTGINAALNPQNWSILQVGVTIAITTDWLPSLPKLAITDISLNWDIYFKSNGNTVTRAMLSGTFTIGSGNDTADLIVEMTYPDWVIHAYLQDGDSLDLSAGMNYFTGGSVNIPNLKVTVIDFEGRPLESTYMFYTSIENVPPEDNPFQQQISFGSFRQLNMEVDYNAGMLSGYIMGQFEIQGQMFYVQAHKLPGANAGWMFVGGLVYGYEFTAQNFVDAVAGSQHYTLPDSLKQLALTELRLRFNTALSTYYILAALGWKYSIPGANIDLDVSARFELQADRMKLADNLMYKGMIEGGFNINNFGLLIRYSFAPGSSAVLFVFKYKKFELSATVSFIPDPKDKNKQQTIVTIGFGDCSFGEIIEYLVHLASPNSEFVLESPWDFLYDINFKNLTLTANLTTKEVGIHYAIQLDLLFVNIKTIGLTYKTVNGKGKVMASITGYFLDKEFGQNGKDPLEWDMIDDPAPEVPGEESAFIDIRYVGLGQHMSINNAGDFGSVEEVINALRAYMLPPESNSENPLTNAPGLKFDENSHWLFGLDVTIIGTVRLAVVFNDPQLYGLLIGLSGERAKALAGLSFQVLYVKISDTIGVFRIAFQLPEQFRQLEFGAVSITLPVLKLEIYTNGDFRVDLGFPHNADFSNSFSLQIFPFIGYGGFYFAKLSGATSKRVPEISNGNFNPVIELGLGISVGLGKTFNKGPLKAGISITVVGIVEGVLAWFNPKDETLPAPMYYWMQGTIAIVGKLYGSVDFAVIKVEVSVTAYASVTLVIECYAPIVIELKVGVEVEASVKILFVRVHFSFSLEIHETFTIGDRQPTPWILRQPTSAPQRGLAALGSRRLRMQQTAVRRSVTHRTYARQKMALMSFQMLVRQGVMLQATTPASALHWNPSTSFLGSIQDVHITLAPSFTVAIPSSLPGGSGNTPAVQAVMTLFAENTIPSNANDSKALRQLSLEHSARVQDIMTSPFNILVQVMLAYVTNAMVGAADKISLADLELLNDLLTDKSVYQAGFSYTQLQLLMTNNFLFQVSGIPSTGAGSTPVQAGTSSATIFPMPPALTMQLNGGNSIDFATQPYQVDANYEEKIAEYLQQLSVNVLNNVATSEDNDAVVAAKRYLTDNATDSFATMIFRDYFLMIARASVQESINLLTRYPWTVSTGDSLAGIAGNEKFPKASIVYEVQVTDTWQSVANMFNMTVAELQQLNPQVPTTPIAPPLELTVLSGVTVQEIATTNQDVLLNKSIPAVTIGNILYQAKGTDSMNSIAQYFGISVPALAAFNANSLSLLAEGAILAVGQPQTQGVSARFSYTSVAGDSLNFIAAWFQVRNAVIPGSDVPPAVVDGAMYSWYLQTIASLNPSILDWTSVAAGTVISLPNALNNTQPPLATYTTRSGDRLEWIAGYFAMTQNANTVLTSFTAAIQAMNPQVNWNNLQPNTAILIPGMERTIQGNDTLSALSTLYSIPVADLATVNGSQISVIAALSVWAIPPASYAIQEGDTLAILAARYNLGLDDLAWQLKDVQNIFPLLNADQKPLVLTIPAIPLIKLDDLKNDLIGKGHGNNISATVSRFLMHGLRLPLPADVPPGNAVIPPNTPMYPVYALSGQQFTAPPQPIAQAYNVLFSATNPTPWINFADSYVVQPGDTKASLLAQYPDIQTLNPQVNLDDIKPGWVLLTAITSTLTIPITQDLANNEYPSTTFSPVFNQPTLMRLYDDQKVRYAMQKVLHWQIPAALNYPTNVSGGVPNSSPLAGEPGIWLFPAPLLSRLEAGTLPTNNYQLSYLSAGAASPDTVTPVKDYLWGTLLSFQLKAVASTTGQGSLPNTYEISTTDTGNRSRLLNLWTYLQDNSNDIASLYFLYPPSSAGSNPSGLMSATVNAQDTFILKTNLSTETTSGGLRRNLAAVDVNSVGAYSAPFSDPVNFLKFIWEAIILGTGGYYLTYTAGGNGLPPTVFDQSGNATVWLMVTLKSQTQSSPTVRNLKAFNNCAVSGDNLDPAQLNVFVSAIGNFDLQRTSNVPPGNTGFDMLMTNPEPGKNDPVTPAIRTKVLFSLFGYQAQSASLFGTGNQSLPLSPQDPTSNPAAPHGLAAFNEEDTVWHFHQVVPVAPLALAHALPQSAALPDPLLDPYAGIAIDSTTHQLGAVPIAFHFYDIFGNYTTPDMPVNNLSSPVGYYDDIIGFSQWPGLALTYYLSGTGGASGEPDLNLLFSFRIEDYIAGGGLSFEQAVRAASTHFVRYRQVYYQLTQADVDLTMNTSLVQTTVAPIVNQSYEINKGQVLAYVFGSYVFLTTVSQLTPGLAVIAVNANNTLTQITNSYHVSYQDLAAANMDRKAVDIFLGTLNIPYFLTTSAGQSLNDIVTAANAMKPPATLTIQDIVDANVNAVLNQGINFSVPSRNVTVNTAAGSASKATLNSLAASLYTSVPAMAAANASPATSIINQGVLLTIDGLQYTTQANDSFANIAVQFNAQSKSLSTVVYTPESVAGANANVPNLILANAQLAINVYATVLNDTFPVIAQRFPAYTAAVILGAQENLAKKNVYNAGQALKLFSRTETPFANDTILSIATSYALTPEDIFGDNLSTPLQTANHGTVNKPTNVLTIPQLVAIDQTLAAEGYVPYSIRSGDTLNAIATAFYGNASSNLALAALNQQVPWLLAPGQPVSLGAPTTTIAGDSFQSVLNRVNSGGGVVTLTQLVDLITGTPGYLQANAFMACPLPSTGGAVTSLQALETSFHCPAGDIVRANSSLSGLLAAGLPVVVNGKTLTIQASDTFHSLVYRFKTEQNIDITLAALAVACKTQSIIAINCRFLLPPAVQLITQGLGVGYSIAPHYPATIFEVTVAATIQRDKNNLGLLNPDFTHVEAVKQHTSTIAPRAEHTSDGQLSLLQFARDMEQAFTGLKAATGNHNDSTAQGSVWAIYFGASGISQFTIDIQNPSYYALKPLSNTLVSKNNVYIKDYAGGQLTDGSYRNYQNIDMESWAQTLLAAVDLFLTPAYASPASQLQGTNGYNRLVEAKKTLAGRISTGLDYVLTGGTDTDKREKARAALKDNLLINLTEAYDSDAMLQYDVNVTAAFSDAIAPRLSGTPVSKLYLTGAADSVSSIAAANHVAVNYLAGKIGAMTGILHTGLVVSYPGKDNYTIVATDTLLSLAAHYEVNVETLVASLTWQNPSTQGLFLPSTLINIVSVSHATGTQTIEQLADYFMVSVEEWAEANLNNQGVFINGITITLPGYTPVLISSNNNTLAQVAAAMGGNPVMTATLLATALRSSATVLAADFISYSLLTGFDYSVSTAKASLATGTNQVNFLFNVKDQQSFRKALLGIRYIIDEVEYNIKDVKNDAGYQASSWLTLILPVGKSPAGNDVIHTDLGQPEIPLPLRSYPSAPVINAQTAEATYTDEQLPHTYPQNIQKAKLWNFSFTFSHDEAAQDTSYIMSSFNLGAPLKAGNMTNIVDDGFFQAFAQFIEVWPLLKPDLDALLSGASDQTTIDAVNTFATLVENLGNTWTYATSLLTDSAVLSLQFFEYGITYKNEMYQGTDYKHSITLTPVSAGNSGPGNSYPDIYYRVVSDSSEEVKMSAAPGTSDCVYSFPANTVKASLQIAYRVQYNSLDILEYQNAIGGAYAARNLFLADKATNPAFVFQTPEVLFTNNIIPYIDRSQALPFGNAPADLQVTLSTLFTDLLASNTPLIKVTSSYGYELAAGTDSGTITSQLPIAFLPMQPFANTIAQDLAQVVHDWLGSYVVATSKGELIFDISIFGGNDATQTQPLLRLSDLIYGLENKKG